MKILLDAIQFDHDPGSAARDALTIRWDAAREVVLPEWRRGACVGLEDSPAAYAIAETRGHTITIKARFRKVVPGFDSVEVRALDPTLMDHGWLAAWLRRVGILRLPPGNPLGEVAPRRVSFGADGLSPFETFELTGTRLEELGVGAWTTTWQWQYRQAGGRWLDFDRSEHRTFVLLETPKEPWTQQVPMPAGLVLPRVDALEYACRWARGDWTPVELFLRGAASIEAHIRRLILAFVQGTPPQN
jgi:hypothetical protein